MWFKEVKQYGRKSQHDIKLKKKKVMTEIAEEYLKFCIRWSATLKFMARDSAPVDCLWHRGKAQAGNEVLSRFTVPVEYPH